MEAVEKSLHQKAKYKRVSLQRKPPHRALIKMASNADSVFFVFLHFHGESIANNLNVNNPILWCLPIFFSSFFLLSGSHHSARWHDAGGLCQKVSEEFHQRSGCRTCGNWHHGKNGLYQLTSTPSKHSFFSIQPKYTPPGLVYGSLLHFNLFHYGKRKKKATEMADRELFLGRMGRWLPREHLLAKRTVCRDVLFFEFFY